VTTPRCGLINRSPSVIDSEAPQPRAAGIEVTPDPQTYPNGRFASTADPEGNPIELWEPTPTGSRSLPTATADPRSTQALLVGVAVAVPALGRGYDLRQDRAVEDDAVAALPLGPEQV